MAETNQCGDSKDQLFTSNQGQFLVGEKKYTVRVLKMIDATMIFLSATEPECLDELAVAMKMPQDDQIIGTTILGAQGTTTDSQRMAEKLTKRFGRQFFVSYNVQADLTAPLLEKQLSEYIRNNV